MREFPIIFAAESVKAILANRKTMTRRVVKPQPDDDARITMGEIGTSRGVAYIGSNRSGGGGLRECRVLIGRLATNYGCVRHGAM